MAFFKVILGTTILALAGSAAGSHGGPSPDEDCPFFPASCPVTSDNVLDLFYFDQADKFSCQRHCLEIEDCRFFTQYEEPYEKHMKCFLFKSCDHLEPCPECTSGPVKPPITDCTPDNDRYTCNTERANIAGVFYFDYLDPISCDVQCALLEECRFWTYFGPSDGRQKCFLYRDCNVHEPCWDCVTGSRSL